MRSRGLCGCLLVLPTTLIVLAPLAARALPLVAGIRTTMGARHQVPAFQRATLLPTNLVFELDDCGAMSVRPTGDQARYVLRGTCPFRNSVASAVVTHLGSDRFHLSLTAEHLPSPTILRVKFVRHAYVAWLVSGGVLQGLLHMAAVGLVSAGGAGNYAGQGIVAINGVTSVIITAEPTAQAHMPIMPVLTLLASTGHQL